MLVSQHAWTVTLARLRPLAGCQCVVPVLRASTLVRKAIQFALNAIQAGMLLPRMPASVFAALQATSRPGPARVNVAHALLAALLEQMAAAVAAAAWQARLSHPAENLSAFPVMLAKSQRSTMPPSARFAHPANSRIAPVKASVASVKLGSTLPVPPNQSAKCASRGLIVVAKVPVSAETAQLASLPVVQGTRSVSTAQLATFLLSRMPVSASSAQLDTMLLHQADALNVQRVMLVSLVTHRVAATVKVVPAATSHIQRVNRRVLCAPRVAMPMLKMPLSVSIVALGSSSGTPARANVKTALKGSMPKTLAGHIVIRARAGNTNTMAPQLRALPAVKVSLLRTLGRPFA